MSLREEVNKIAEELAEWYVREVEFDVEMMEEDGIPLFFEEVPDKVPAEEPLSVRGE